VQSGKKTTLKGSKKTKRESARLVSSTGRRNQNLKYPEIKMVEDEGGSQKNLGIIRVSSIEKIREDTGKRKFR